MDSYLRLTHLKHRRGLGYETLVKEVADSLSWRRFCRIGSHKAADAPDDPGGSDPARTSRGPG
ncbi:MAG: hypothetical protein HYX33_04365 [Actinobacteria bacterium]|nr:hypothetical protein [Actinomycetota bacterium]